ncbi:MAG: 5-(carboxyamino)imidazole ribonucleotide mutase [Halodesulfurarchaeum sp.]
MTSVAELRELFEREAALDRPAADRPDVGIIMGSDSDLDVMAGASKTLEALGFEELTEYDDPPAAEYTYESWVVSAHRTPDLMYAYGETAEARGLDVILAGAGGKSADLPNMTASIAYPVPVIGIPVREKSVDSVIGMPTGAPITAVDAGKSSNAALSAVQILARTDDTLRDRLVERHEDQAREVAAVSRSLHERGTQAFRDSN